MSKGRDMAMQIGKTFLLAVASVWSGTVASAQTDAASPGPTTPPVEQCDLACQILKMPFKPGGGGGINYLDPKVQALDPGTDLGVLRPPAEQLRLPAYQKDQM